MCPSTPRVLIDLMASLVQMHSPITFASSIARSSRVLLSSKSMHWLNSNYYLPSERVEGTLPHNSGVVDQQIDSAVGFLDPSVGLLDGLLIRDITFNGVQLTLGAEQAQPQLLDLIFASSQSADDHSGFDELLANGGTDSTRRTRNNGHTTVPSIHFAFVNFAQTLEQDIPSSSSGLHLLHSRCVAASDARSRLTRDRIRNRMRRRTVTNLTELLASEQTERLDPSAVTHLLA